MSRSEWIQYLLLLFLLITGALYLGNGEETLYHGERVFIHLIRATMGIFAGILALFLLGQLRKNGDS
jgi:hypothetical protein